MMIFKNDNSSEDERESKKKKDKESVDKADLNVTEPGVKLNLNCISAVTCGAGETHNHNLDITAEAKELSSFLVQMEEPEEVKVKIELKQLDNDSRPFELITFTGQPDLDIKKDSESDATEILQWINENRGKDKISISDPLDIKLDSEIVEENERIQRELISMSQDDSKCTLVLTDIPMTDAEKQNRKCPKAVAVMMKPPLLNFLYKCPKYDCSFATTLALSFQKHFATHQSILMDTLVPCLYCDYKVLSSSYVIHLEVKHSHCLFGCGDCFYRTTNSYFVTMHRELAHPNTEFNILQLEVMIVNRISTDTTSPNLSELVLPYNCEEDGFLNCPFKTLYFDEYLKHVEAIHKVDGLGSFLSKHQAQKEAVMEGWLAKDVGPFQCRYCKKATVTHQEMGRHQALHHAQEQCLFYYRKFVPNETVVIPEQVDMEDPSFINHLIHLPDQIHLCNFKLMDGLLSSTSAKLTNWESEESLPFLPPPAKDIETYMDQSNISADEPETFTVLVNDEACLFDESDSLYLDELAKDDSVHNNEMCKWKGCYQTYHFQTALVKHIQKNHVQLQRGKELTCFWSNCPRKSKPYTTKHNLLVHMRIHSGEKPYKCGFQGCNKAFSQPGTLKIHQRRHTSERPYLCQFSNCFKSFFTNYARNNHQKIHYDPEAYACQFTGCSKKYGDPSSLQKHMKNHITDEQLETKEKLGEDKEKEGNGAKHQRTHYDTLQCKWMGCYQTYHSQRTLVEHIEKNHVQLQKGEEFTCFWSNCLRKSKPFTIKRNLLIHMRIHTGEKPHKCPFQGCNKAFSQPGTLKIHQRGHTGEKPYLCQFSNCFKRFSTSYDKDNHQRLHYDTEAYACRVVGCSKKYTHPNNLWTHMKKHTVGEQLEAKRKFVENKQRGSDCMLKKLSNSLNEAKHERTHYDTCKWTNCYQLYYSQTALAKHIEKNHVQMQRGRKFTCFWINCLRKWKPYTSKQSLLIHMRVHSGEKLYKCAFQGCKEAFSRLDNLKAHRRSHIRKKTYLCQFSNYLKGFSHTSIRGKHQRIRYRTCKWKGCYQTYHSQMALVKHIEKNHIRLQSGEEFICFWINCPRNLKPFTIKQNLLIHVGVHSKEKSHKRPFQGRNKPFSEMGTLKIHQRFSNCFRSFNIKAFACQVAGCSKKYTDRRNLWKHMKNHAVNEELDAKQKPVENKPKENDFIIYDLSTAKVYLFPTFYTRFEHNYSKNSTST